MGLINQKGNAQFFQRGIFLQLLQDFLNLLDCRDNDRLSLLQEARQVVGFSRKPTTSFRWVKFAMSSRIFVSSDLRSVRMNVMSTNFSFVPGLYRQIGRAHV